MRPGVALAVLTFLHGWNDYLWPLVSARQRECFTITPGLASIQSNFAQSEGQGRVMASGVIASLAVVILFLVVQRHVVQAMTVGGTPPDVRVMHRRRVPELAGLGADFAQFPIGVRLVLALMRQQGANIFDGDTAAIGRDTPPSERSGAIQDVLDRELQAIWLTGKPVDDALADAELPDR